ncbi:centromere protein W-like isoform X2 [Ptychodera flava]|uniref:centromere protein W-like isoform X2 n=1 Tax=Ptychodera flava TaxID=63121 RepID=UPI00396A71DC
MKILKRRFAGTNVRRALKSTSKRPNDRTIVEKNIEILIFLDYMSFLQRLAEKSNEKAKEEKEHTISQKHIDAVMKVLMLVD